MPLHRQGAPVRHPAGAEARRLRGRRVLPARQRLPPHGPAHPHPERAPPALELGFEIPADLPIAKAAAAPRSPAAARRHQETADFPGRDRLLAFLRERFPQHGPLVSGWIHGGFYVTAKTESRWCGNVGRQHNGNRTYLHVTEHGAQQRCHCRCDTLEGRRYGLCSRYRSPTVPLPPEIRRELGEHENVLPHPDSDEEEEAGDHHHNTAAASSASEEPHRRLSLFLPHGRTDTLVSVMRSCSKKRPASPPPKRGGKRGGSKGGTGRM